MLALVALEVGLGVRKVIDAMVAHDDSSFVPCIPWESGVTDGIDISGTYPLAHLELWRDARVLARCDTAAKPTGGCFQRESRFRS